MPCQLDSYTPARQRVIGLTGNIACGKSTVANVLRELGAEVVDADVLSREALAPSTAAFAAVVAEWGPGVLTRDGEIDRRRLGTTVFGDPTALRKLESFVHPVVIAAVKGAIASARGPLVVDAVKLIESGLADLCDEVWVVTCPPKQQLARLRARDGLSDADALLRIRAQPPQSEKVAAADVVIHNEGSLADTRQQVRVAWARAGSEPDTEDDKGTE